MGARRSGREVALQVLFQVELTQQTGERALQLFWQHHEGDPEGRSYAETLVLGVERELVAVDEKLRAASTHWRLERMARIDRNLLRMGAWELLHQTEVPIAVVIDECIELAKSFGTDDSPSFVNGVLNRVAELALTRA